MSHSLATSHGASAAPAESSKAAHERKTATHDEEKGVGGGAVDFSHFGVVPDVVTRSPPSLAHVRYGARDVQLGHTLLVKDTQQQPHVDWPVTQAGGVAASPQLYTIIMCDPDAPSRATPKFRSWLHWLVVNVPDPSHVSKGRELMSYMGPAPPPNTGLHRYCFLVYRQKAELSASEAGHLSDAQRKSWSVASFLQQHARALDESGLIAGNMFQAANEQQETHK